MGWVTPSTQATGHKVTATEWNELVNDLRYLKGLDGAATIQDGLVTQELIPDANSTHDLGSNAARYRDVYVGGETFLGDAGYITGAVASGTSGVTHISRNAYYDGAWKRRVADNDASLLVLDSDSSLKYYTQSDANNTADSAITFVERLQITQGGLTLGKLPGFAVHTSGSISNVTGDGTNYTVLFDTEDYDSNSAYTPGTGIFTAPYTGVYHFDTFLFLQNVASVRAAGTIRLILTTTTGSYTLYREDPAEIYEPASGNILSISGSVTVPMTVGDQALINLFHSGNTGGKITDIFSGTFAGFLVAKTA